MCACKQKSSFLIDDILSDAKNRHKPSCSLDSESQTVSQEKKVAVKYNELETKFNVMTEVDRELELTRMKANLEQRRNTYPLYPTPIKANVPWPYKVKSYPMEARHVSFYSDPMLKSDQILRNQLAVNRFMPTSYSLRQPYGFDRGG